MEDLTGKNIGPYQVIAPLGEGGMAAVFKAYHPNMDRYVALKVLPQHFSKQPDFRERFSREARMIANLEHPNILPVYDFGEAAGYTYLVMRLVECGSLADQLHSGKRFSYGEINRIISQVGGGLGYAHSRGVIHRDIKPANILIDSINNCLLTDFGVAKMIEATSHLTKPGSLIGTPFYMSPEQGMGYPVDQRSDIYSLGVVLYQLVTGVLPFNAETPMAVMFKHIHDPLPPPGSLVRALPEKIERIILKAMAKEPSGRHEKAETLVLDLNSALMEVDENLIPSFSVGATESIGAPSTIQYNAETIPTPPSFGEKKPLVGRARAKKWFSIRWALLTLGVLVSASLVLWFYTSRDFYLQQTEVSSGVGDSSPLQNRPEPQPVVENGGVASPVMNDSLSQGPDGRPSLLPEVADEKKSFSGPSEKTRILQDQIGEALDNDQTETALVLLNTLLDQRSDLAEPYCQRGHILFDKEFFSSAKADFIKCRENIRDNDPEELGGEAAAMEALAEARSLALGQHGATEHLEVIDKALERTDAPSWLRCERAQLNMDMEDYGAALADFQACDRAPELDPYWRARVESGSEEARGNIASEQGDKEAALKHFRKWAVLAPGDADPHCYQGDIYNDLERYEEGLQSFQRCAQLARDPGVKQWADFSIAVTSGLLAKQRGESDQAVDFLNRALVLSPTEVWIHCELGDLHADIGKKEQAKKYFQTCRSLAGDDRDLRQWADDMLKELK